MDQTSFHVVYLLQLKQIILVYLISVVFTQHFLINNQRNLCFWDIEGRTKTHYVCLWSSLVIICPRYILSTRIALFCNGLFVVFCNIRFIYEIYVFIQINVGKANLVSCEISTSSLFLWTAVGWWWWLFIGLSNFQN